VGDYCLPIEAEILTKEGFKIFDQVKNDDIVAGYKNGELIWTKMIRRYVSVQPTLLLQSKLFQVECSPNHQWVVDCCNNHKKRKRKPSTVTSWPRKIEAKKLKTGHKIILTAKLNDNGKINLTKDEIWLLGWVMTDGFITHRGANTFTIGIAQSKEPNRTEIRTRLKEWITKEYLDECGEMSRFNIQATKFKKLCNKINIHPNEVKEKICSLIGEMSVEQREELLDALVKAEGWIDGGRVRFAQKEGNVLNAFYMLCALLGYRTGCAKTREDGIVTVSIIARSNKVDVSELKIKENYKKRFVWCPKTECGTWVFKLKNQIGITGNCDWISPGDKRFDPSTVTKDMRVQQLSDLGDYFDKELKKYFSPIKEKGLGLLRGNHLKKFQVATSQENLHSRICKDLGMADFGYTCMFDLVFIRDPKAKKVTFYRNQLPPNCCSRTQFRVFAQHGAGYSQSPGGKLNRLLKYMDDFDANIYFIGHVHDQVGKRKVQVGANEACTKLTDKVKLGVITGSYLRTYAQQVLLYGELKGYSPVPLGARWVEIHPDTREVKASI